MNPDIVLETEHMKKYDQAIHAVEDVSFSLNRGDTFGFPGPNGVGKTTTIRMN